MGQTLVRRQVALDVDQCLFQNPVFYSVDTKLLVLADGIQVLVFDQILLDGLANKDLSFDLGI